MITGYSVWHSGPFPSEGDAFPVYWWTSIEAYTGKKEQQLDGGLPGQTEAGTMGVEREEMV